MVLHNEYSQRISLRNSDKSINTSTNLSAISSQLSSENWEQLSDGFENAKDTATAISGFAGVIKHPLAKSVSLAAAAAAAAGLAAEKFAKKQAEIAKANEAKAKEAQRIREKRAREARARAKRIKENSERAGREHRESMRRGEYRDPPTRERMAEIGRTC